MGICIASFSVLRNKSTIWIRYIKAHVSPHHPVAADRVKVSPFATVLNRTRTWATGALATSPGVKQPQTDFDIHSDICDT